jgi:hypothetical protein
VNNNGQAGTPVIAYADSGAPLTVTEIDETLNEYGFYQAPGDATLTQKVQVAPPSDWRFGEITCSYITVIIEGYRSDGPKPGGGRHQWLLKQAVRLACAWMLGCITENDYRRAQKLLAQQFTHLLATREPRREPGKLEIDGAWEFGVEEAATKTSGEAGKELGGWAGHTHASTESTPPRPHVIPITLDQCHNIFRRRFGLSYDTDALDITLATAAVERLDGDPVWVMIISGPGATKTETVQPLTGIGAIITSAITSAGALLSATSAKERTTGATGGLLRKIGKRGILVIKDFTTILSMDRNARAEVLAALREVFDGYWQRNVGTDGGRSLSWRGRLIIVAACTTAWDKAHAVISVMGNRFVLVRIDSGNENAREESGIQSILNLGSEAEMRQELADAVAGVTAGIDIDNPPQLDGAESLVLVRVANLATKARTAVEVDYRGDVEDAHAPEAPTRFAKQLAQIVRGAIAIGVDRQTAMKLAIRCAGDSIPPLRQAILKDIGANPAAISTAVEVAKRIDKPRTTVDRQLQALHALGLATVKPGTSPWDYALKAGTDPRLLNPEHLPEMLVKAHKDTRERREKAAE